MNNPFTTNFKLSRNASGLKAASNFDSGQTGSVADSAPSMVSPHEATSSEASSDVPSTGTVPGSNTGAPGEVSHADPLTASGSNAGASGTSGTVNPDATLEPAGPAGERHAPNILGGSQFPATKAVDPALYQTALEAVQAVITAEVAEPSPDFGQIATLSDIGRTLSAPDDDSVSVLGDLS